MNENTLIEKEYKNVISKNSNYSLGKLLKVLGLSALITFATDSADAQVKKVRNYPVRGNRTIVRNPRVPFRARTTGRFIPRTAYVPTGINFVYSRGYYGYLQRGFFYPFGFGPNSYAFVARQMFCQYPLMRWNGPWAIPVEQAEESQEIQDYQARIRELEQENMELREKEDLKLYDETITALRETREAAERKIKELRKEEKYPEYRFGYENGGMYPSQWISETASYFNWYFNMEGNVLHAYSNAAVYIDGKKHYFDIVVRDKQNNPLYIFEFRGNGDPEEKQKIALIETGKAGNAYVITPASDRGPYLEKQLRPYKDMMLHTNF